MSNLNQSILQPPHLPPFPPRSPWKESSPWTPMSNSSTGWVKLFIYFCIFIIIFVKGPLYWNIRICNSGTTVGCCWWWILGAIVFDTYLFSSLFQKIQHCPTPVPSCSPEDTVSVVSRTLAILHDSPAIDDVNIRRLSIYKTIVLPGQPAAHSLQVLPNKSRLLHHPKLYYFVSRFFLWQ